jgi:hypothetical protein
MLQIFEPFHSYIVVSVFMLQVAIVLSGCCISSTHMLQVYVLNVSSALDVRCIQVFHVSEVCPESHRTRLGCWGFGRWGTLGSCIWVELALILGPICIESPNLVLDN